MILQEIKHEEKISKAGKPYITCNLKIQGLWYYGFGKQGLTDKWQPGQDVDDIILYDEEWNGQIYKHWKLETLTMRVEKLEKRVEALERAPSMIEDVL